MNGTCFISILHLNRNRDYGIDAEETMTKRLCFAVLICSLSMLTAIENTTIEPDSVISNLKDAVFYLKVSPGILWGGSIGYGKLIGNRLGVNEMTLQYHYHTQGAFMATGLFIQGNMFKTIDRTGWFLQGIFGLDYTHRKDLFTFGDPGGSNASDHDITSKIYKGLYPNMAVGFGISSKKTDNSYFRITFDIGYKILICNLNLEYCF